MYAISLFGGMALAFIFLEYLAEIGFLPNIQSTGKFWGILQNHFFDLLWSIPFVFFVVFIIPAALFKLSDIILPDQKDKK